MITKADIIDNTELQKEAFWKGLKVIQSCKDEFHLNAAQKYINLFFEQFSIIRRKTVYPTVEIVHFYEVLQTALKEQRKKLNY